MAKITKTEFLENIQNIINEGLTPNQHVDHTKKFEIGRYVAGLFESGQRDPKLMTYLNNYNNLLNSGNTKEFMLFEQFGQGLTKYATGNKAVKNVINEMNDTINNYGNELEAYRLIECIQNPATQDAVRCAYDNYLDEEDDDSRKILIDAIDYCDQEHDPVAPKLMIIITNDVCSRLPQIEIGTSESKFDEIQRKIKEDKQRKQIEDVKAQVYAYAKKTFDDAEAEKKAAKEDLCFESIINNNGLNLHESIKNIASSDAKSNKKLMETLEQYAGALNQGLYEERLYEGFLNNISKFNYLNSVEKEIKRINEVAAKKSGPILVTKILEEMTNSGSYYIIPLIEEDCARYVKNPNDLNRSQLRAALCSFASDPYCNAILEAIDRDGNMIANTLDEKSLSVKDQIKMIRENANVSPIYSPVQYIKENECIFNANGQFYVKKGNTLAKLSDEYLNQLSESFIALCQLVNDPHVSINKDYITLYGNDKIANIYEGYAEINGCKETQDTLRDLNEMSMKYDFDTNFFIMASCLLENFNNIANVNFGKHVALNGNEGINVDMFRLGNNIFVNAVNEDMLKSTFYHNVNPIQCRNIINKHMGINVASLFEDLLPSQDKLLMKLNETKNEYEASIEKYEAAIEKLKAAKEDCTTEENEKKLDDAIESAKKKVEDLKKEYKDWQTKAEASVNAKDNDEEAAEKADKKKKESKADKEVEDDPNTDVEKTVEPIKADEVDDAKDELTQPIDSSEEDPTISDDEFDSYLNDEEPTEADDAEETPEDDEPESNEVEATPDDDEAFSEITLDDDDTEAEPVEADAESELENGDVEDYNDEPLAGETIDEPESEEDFEIEDEPEVEPAEEPEVKIPEGYKIANISFDQNIKTGELFKTGTITIVCPMVSADGRMYVESNDYNFFIDAETHIPVIDAADVPVALYNALVAAIQQDENFIKADAEGVEEIPAEEQEIKAKDIFYKADEVDDASKELEKDDDDIMFDFSEDPDGESFTISAKEEPEAEDEIVVSDEKPAAVIPTYKNGETEIELPAPSVDKSEIPEITAKEAKIVKDEENTDSIEESKISLNEARKAFIKLKAEYNKGDQHFFLSEGTIKPSKKEDAHVNETFDGIDLNGEDPIIDPIEDYEEEYDIDTLGVMRARAASAAQAANISVSDIKSEGPVNYFEILYNGEPVYTVFTYDNKIYYKKSEDFNVGLNALKLANNDDPSIYLIYNGEDELEYIDINDIESAKDLINTILLSIDIKSLPLSENIKIKRPSVKAESFEDSKCADDILHGDEHKRKFEKDVEEETSKEGIPNPLIPAQQEAAQILPNAHALSEAKVEAKDKRKIVYQPLDWVIIKETGMKAQVTNVVNNDNGDLTMLTILASNGTVYDVDDLTEIEPDPLYLENVPGRRINSQNLVVPRLSDFDIDPKTRLTRFPENETIPAEDAKTTPVYITMEGQHLTSEPVSALLEDVANSNEKIRIINEDQTTSEYNRENIEFAEMPFAVVVDSEGKPIRSIQIDPKSYIEATDDELIDCLVDGKITKFPKKCIDVLS